MKEQVKFVDKVGFMPVNADALRQIFTGKTDAEIIELVGMPAYSVNNVTGVQTPFTLEESLGHCEKYVGLISAGSPVPNTLKYVFGEPATETNPGRMGIARGINLILLTTVFAELAEPLKTATSAEVVAAASAFQDYLESPNDDTLLFLDSHIPGAIDFYTPKIDAAVLQEAMQEVQTVVSDEVAAPADEVESDEVAENHDKGAEDQNSPEEAEEAEETEEVEENGVQIAQPELPATHEMAATFSAMLTAIAAAAESNVVVAKALQTAAEVNAQTAAVNERIANALAAMLPPATTKNEPEDVQFTDVAE